MSDDVQQGPKVAREVAPPPVPEQTWHRDVLAPRLEALIREQETGRHVR